MNKDNIRDLLKVEGLTTHFATFRGLVKAVEGVELDVRRQEVVGLIGETGCGKTVTAYSILRLIRPPGRIAGGKVLFRGTDLLCLDEKHIRRIRGKEISMIFQRPMSSLNPVFTVGKQLEDVIRLHDAAGRKRARELAIQSLALAMLPEPASVMGKYPHELSGGMQQRTMIAMALACGSSLLIADEPTTALDVSIQLQIMKLIRKIVDNGRMSVLLISHDMSVVGSMCDRVNVMYAGTIVESCDKKTIIDLPKHPYTRALLQAVPAMFSEKGQRLKAISGVVPSLISPPKGCRFAPRCPVVMELCTIAPPTRVAVGNDHYISCHRFAEREERNRPLLRNWHPRWLPTNDISQTWR